jgi:G:T-mismatch repair DNA endonuclease (very short patch repair protein)
MDLKNIFDKNGNLKGSKVIQKHYPLEYDYIFSKTNFLNPDEVLRGRIYFLKNKLIIEDVKCRQCQNLLLFKDSKIGFGIYCDLNCSENCIIKKGKTKSSNLKNYGVVWAQQSNPVRAKRQQTILLKYGVVDIFSSPIIQQTIKSNNLKKIGVSYPFQSASIQEFAQLQKQANYISGNNVTEHLLNFKDWNDSNFWVNNFIINDNFHIGKARNYFNCAQPSAHKQLKKLGIRYKKLSGYSIKEHQLHSMLLDLNINFITNDRSIIKPLELDIYIPDLKLAIEYNGSYWHSYHPIKGTVLKQNDLNYSTYRHQAKTIACLEQGIRLLHIYEDEAEEVQKARIDRFLAGTEISNNLDDGCYPLDLDISLITEPVARIVCKDRLLFNAGTIKE